jgi:F0F1-type ATP synthase assembly protein I
MPETPPDERSPMAIAMEWSARITTIGLEMALPAGGGYWLDQRFHTLPVFATVGALLGFAVGFYHLLQMARRDNRKDHK